MNCSYQRGGWRVLAFRVVLCSLLGTTAAQTTGAAESPNLRTVALSRGAIAPGMNHAFDSFWTPPVLNDAGRTAFSAWAGEYVAGDPEFYRGYGIWSEGTGNLELAARGGDVAPGTALTIQYLSNPTIDSAGRTVFWSHLSQIPGEIADGAAIYRTGPAGLAPLAIRGQQAADSSSIHVYSWLGQPQVNDVGQIAFLGGLGTSVQPGVDAFWAGDPHDLKLALRTGAEEYGDSEKYSVSMLGSSSPTPDAAALNNTGVFVFEAWLDHRGLPPQTLQHSLWRHDENGAAPIVRQDDDAPGTGNTFARFGTPTLNDAGQIVFTAKLTNPQDYWRPYEGGLWMIDGNVLKNILPAAMPAPGMPGVTIHADDNSAIVNGQGEVTFAAYLQGDGLTSENHESLWRLKGDSLELIARQGALIPGSDSPYLGLGNVAINNAGQVAFMSTRRVDGNARENLFVQDPDGLLHEIVSTGSLLEVAPGDFREVTHFAFMGGSGLEDGRRVGFNERGQVAFRADFTDGSSGMFVSSLAAIPEPAACSLLAMGLAGLSNAQRRKSVLPRSGLGS